MKKLLGIDIGGTKCAIILGNYKDEAIEQTTSQYVTILDRITFPTETEEGLNYTLDRIFENIDIILNKNNCKAKNLSGIGISCGGPLDSKRGIILSPPNLVGWDEVHIVETIEIKYGVKTKLQNDANACALAEWKFGAGRGYRNIVFLTFGTGMGAGLILDGKLYSGTNDMAGEVGHIRLDSNGPVGYGKSGSFEGFCSGGGIAQLAKIKALEKFQLGEKVSFCNSMDELNKLNAKIVAEAAKNGDELAKEIYAISGYYLGKGLSILIDILNPEIIIIGSIFSRSRDLLWPHAEKIIEKECLSYTKKVCKVVTSGLGEKIGDYAALAAAVSDL
ncbi:MAG TPA: ROK family protein [Clostridiales bacterium]|nr:ROK family protein [Clostridiales bacterium]